ncbi:arabinogalactan oligomer/maltooligosaccharide transport system permease protein [Thermocatellispora tengchongensis]|uniref:Arabinogalactan oligomer/maltooligosaccharide transport system permease protein n=1 Tax=Thermocatellispora tengchongensis TaxID=1073253 RepID=A0A840P003_9ACTN|nr:ABC transporter permease subunit [Thermocatellispora tengchongensis]MBB5130587.1 arabinogalactan oligomer/maltooligosaccharide transport system permease protein [Thermocatellispora tengchongensis]
MRGMVVRHAAAIAVTAFAVLPIVFVLSAALDPIGTLNSATLVPRGAGLGNAVKLFTTTPFWTWYRNSVVVSALTAVLSVAVAALAAYAFSRFRFAGRRAGLASLLVIQAFPQFLAIVPLYVIFSTISDNWPEFGLNSVWGVVLLYIGGQVGVNTWLIKGFFDSIPRELDDAMLIDGCSHTQAFRRVVLPLAAPVLAISGLLVFIATINEFLIASVFLTGDDARTLAVGLFGLLADQRNANFGMFAVGTLLTAIPTVAVFQFLQRYIVHGLTAGAVKG